ncbi:50S ribosomal protein L32 [Patescibacteria group bacterium]|nr:50S ribosomal protein L32 [Patescibacteria group bacterium]MBU1200503.1 50S ribosomal protein L32 [Patescibacteria group bacterium]MBU1256513.1 50S ribosomal protein L32 [Patescibacteria group bacterium]MBU1457305.1 50S ribosomal protein L32 [Patescibacteria group bacterium]
MAATPKRKHSTARQGKRRSAISLKKPKLITCSECKKLKRSHFACPNC